MNPTATHLLALAAVQGMDYWAIRGLYEFYPGLEGVWTSSVHELTRRLKAAKVSHATSVAETILSKQRSLHRSAAKQYAALRGRGVSLLCRHDDDFPPALLSIPQPPYWLFVEGGVPVLHRTGVACVGTRQPSREGTAMARWIASALLAEDAVVVSGMADGIDTVAHAEAVERHGRTVAVLGHGLDIPLSSSVQRLRERIVAGGAIVTEYLPQETFAARNFVWRNRLQSGLSVCTVPIEWSPGSGTAHTVRFAVEQRRRVVGVTHESWATADHPEIAGLQRKRAPVLVLPRDLGMLAETCLRAESGTRIEPNRQRGLFGVTGNEG